MQKEKPIVWLLDDDTDYLTFMAMGLSNNFYTKVFSSITQVLKELRKESVELPSLLLADQTLSANCKFTDLLTNGQLGPIHNQTKIMVISGATEQDMIRKLLDLGVEDFFSKPINLDELTIKCEKALSRATIDDNLCCYDKGIVTDPINRDVLVGELKASDLTGREFQILTAILSAGNEGIDKHKLANAVWGDSPIDPRALSVHLAGLRKKLRPLGVQIVFSRQTNCYYYGRQPGEGQAQARA